MKYNIKPMHIFFLRLIVAALIFLPATDELRAQDLPYVRESMWLSEIEAFEAADLASPPVQGGILFVGSSSIRAWGGLPDYFPEFDILQRGVGGSHLEDIVYFADRIVFPYAPRQIVLYEGDNDIKDGFTPERYLEEVKKFVGMVDSHQPGTNIILLSIKPSPARNYLLARYLKTNELMKEYASGMNNVTYVDIVPTVMDSEGKYVEDRFNSDLLHVNQKAYMEWAKIITPYLLSKPQAGTGMVDRYASPATVALYSNLKSVGKRGVMFGHQDDTAYGIGWKYEKNRSDVKSVCGDYPAVYGWEIGGMERGTGQSLDGVNFDSIRQLICEAYQRGGVNTVSWHADNIVTGSDSWDLTGANVVSTILPTGGNHERFLTWLDMVAGFLSSLRDKDNAPIPVIFRPFHEHTGSWFWWGRDFCSTEQYVALWHFTVEYLRESKGLHNLIYCYSPDRVTSSQEYFERYPGDGYVDMLGLDLYHFDDIKGIAEYRKCVETSLDIVRQAAIEKGKPFAFTETGLECITVANWFTEVLYPLVEPLRPAYVLVWRNAYEKDNHFYGPYPGHKSAEDFIRFKELPGVLFSSDIPDMYNKAKE